MSRSERFSRVYTERTADQRAYAWAENRLKQADGLCIGRWALVILDKADIANIVLPAHRHGIELVPDSGLAVSATAEVLRSFP